VPKKIRVMVVDDSKYVVLTVTKKLQADPGIEVIGSAGNGREAVEKVKSLRPDVVTMDVVMPEMDGIAALEKIMAECPTPVIMLSALTSANAGPTIRALQLGAVDFYLKPSAISPAGATTQNDELIVKIKAAASSNISRKDDLPEIPAQAAVADRPPVEKRTKFNKLVVIGSSTGGPRALMQVVPYLPADLPAAVLIVQHMPPVFTRSLAERMASASKIEVMEAREGSQIARGRALLAPGDFHMVMNEKHCIVLNQEPQHLGVRPCVDYTLKSASQIFGASVLAVILTGMGMDGTQGAILVKAKGGRVFAQDEATSAVYGMPQSVYKAGCVEKVIPLNRIAQKITEACTNQE
jgi:two-component system, chemotaxis family, protein-glutamate methylesterase/glutaminase